MKSHRGLTPLNAAIATNNCKISGVLMHRILNPKIEKGEFMGCCIITELCIPDGIRIIECNTFSDCILLKKYQS